MSGVEGEWIENVSDLPDATLELLRLAGEVYLPFLHANAAAANAGEDRFAVTLMGQPYAQAPFGYQVKVP